MHARTQRELAAPRPLRLRPRAEARGAALVRLFVGRREKTWQRGVLREREHAAIDEERLGLVERVQLSIRRQPAIVQPLLAQLRHRTHARERSHGSTSERPRERRPRVTPSIAVAFLPLVVIETAIIGQKGNDSVYECPRRLRVAFCPSAIPPAGNRLSQLGRCSSSKSSTVWS